MKTLAVILLIISLVLESTITTIPLIFLSLLVITSLFKKNFVFVFAYVFGTLFDILNLNTIGISSLFLTIAMFLVLIYQSKFEIATNNFIIISSYLGCLGFLFVHEQTNHIFIEPISGVVIGLILFKLLPRISKI